MKHDGQKRKFTELDYFTHPKWVARKVEEITKNEDLTIAALLHDTIEDTDTTYKEIEKEFGKRVADLVQELTINKEEKEAMGKKKYLAYSMNKMSDCAFTIKLVDRWHNVLFLDADEATLSWVKWYHKETVYILENLQRQFNYAQQVIISNIIAILDFLKIKYNLL